MNFFSPPALYFFLTWKSYLRFFILSKNFIYDHLIGYIKSLIAIFFFLGVHKCPIRLMISSFFVYSLLEWDAPDDRRAKFSLVPSHGAFATPLSMFLPSVPLFYESV